MTHGQQLISTFTITPTDDGPYMIEGPVQLVDPDGRSYDVGDQATIFLCRCGNSAAKPFCDGTHERRGFQAADRAGHNLVALSSAD
jgi:3-phenylpropionate/trans-cinnamate dioxygenase ferredoxin subunit